MTDLSVSVCRDAGFLVNTLSKIDWDAFKAAAETLGMTELPSTVPEDVAGLSKLNAADPQRLKAPGFKP